MGITCLLSHVIVDKSWLAAWHSRNDLDFGESEEEIMIVFMFLFCGLSYSFVSALRQKYDGYDQPFEKAYPSLLAATSQASIASFS